MDLPLRHRRTIAFGRVPPEHRGTLQAALSACDFPLSRIRRRTGAVVPVYVTDLSRFAPSLSARPVPHFHVRNRRGEHGHGLADHRRRRWAPLGLYWLPTPRHPAGRIELHVGTLADPDVAREVLMAELAHAVDYGAMTDAQRARILALFHDEPHEGRHHVGHEWWGDHGGGYWDLPGERWMGLFMAAFAPVLPRPLEATQPWTHRYSETDVAAVRAILRRG